MKIFLFKNPGIVIPQEIMDFLDSYFLITDNCQGAEFIFVLGGDGTMLGAIRKLRDFNKPFFGINFGHVGFLMNHSNTYVLEEFLRGEVEIQALNLIKAKMFDSNEKFIGTEYAFNEFYMERSGVPTAKIVIKANGKIEANPLVCDGVIVASSAGSTAYNAAAGGIILPLGTNSLVLTAICPAVYNEWRTVQLCHDSKIIIKSEGSHKRPVRFLADGVVVENVAQAEIIFSEKQVQIVFVRSESYRDKISALQFHRFSN